MSADQDPDAYFNELQRKSAELDRAKLATLAIEFASTLKQLPKIRAELDVFLKPGQMLDYVGLIKNIRPQLEQAAALLFEIENLNADLRKAPEVKEFAQIIKASMILQTVAPLAKKLPSVCSAAKQTLVEEKNKAESKVRAKAEAKAEFDAKMRDMGFFKFFVSLMMCVIFGIFSGGFIGMFIGGLSGLEGNDSSVIIVIGFIIGGFIGLIIKGR